MAAICTVRIYVGSGVPGKSGRYRGLPLEFDSPTFARFLDEVIPPVFPNATQFHARGLWLGGGEDSTVIEIYEAPTRRGCQDTFRKAKRLARVIARALGQQAVMVIATDARGRSEQGARRGTWEAGGLNQPSDTSSSFFGTSENSTSISVATPSSIRRPEKLSPDSQT